MILNRKQLAVAKKGVEILIEKINVLKNSDAIQDVSQVYAWKCRIEDLTEDIERYEYLINASEIDFSKKNLLEAIIDLRVASGMTQKELADAIMVKEQQIQRYEQDYYQKASFERVVQILRVLGSDIQLKVELKKANTSRNQTSAEASLGIRQSPRGERLTEPTFGPSGIQLRLNC